MNHRGQEPVQRDRGEISCKRCLGALEGSTAMGMRWARYGDEWTAQGDGRRWVVVEHADGEGTGEKRYTLHSRPLEGGAYTEVAKDLGSLEEAQEAAR
jgi:hypothetical protein